MSLLRLAVFGVLALLAGCAVSRSGAGGPSGSEWPRKDLTFWVPPAITVTGGDPVQEVGKLLPGAIADELRNRGFTLTTEDAASDFEVWPGFKWTEGTDYFTGNFHVEVWAEDRKIERLEVPRDEDPCSDRPSCVREAAAELVDAMIEAAALLSYQRPPSDATDVSVEELGAATVPAHLRGMTVCVLEAEAAWNTFGTWSLRWQLFGRRLTEVFRRNLTTAGLRVVRDRKLPHDVMLFPTWSGFKRTPIEGAFALSGQLVVKAYENDGSVAEVVWDETGKRKFRSMTHAADVLATLMAQRILADPTFVAFAETKRPPPAGPKKKGPAGVVVALFEVADQSGRFDDRITSQLTEYLASKLTQVGGYRIIPRAALRRELQDRKLEGQGACFDESCQLELGKAMAAQKSIVTKLLRVGDACLVTSTLFDLQTETTERAASARTTCGETDLIGAIDQVAEQLRAPRD